ncbi:hypothetical protein [Chitinophaga vietnamensis]|uniref:hypothetical protein n=1 Tax=Chitinophaga vietnamensis TaxID=2593957 RepID=UPI001178415F|nr:hypothetical protein [Chitinophaga vietnamensis]
MKNLVVAAALLIAAAPAFAQTAATKAPAAQQAPAKAPQQAPAKAPQAKKQLPPPEERAKIYADELKSKLSLTDDQYKKVLDVNTECIRRKDALKASGQKDAKGFKDISAYRKQQFATILTPDQQAKLKALNAQGGGHGKKDGDDADH